MSGRFPHQARIHAQAAGYRCRPCPLRPHRSASPGARTSRAAVARRFLRSGLGKGAKRFGTQTTNAKPIKLTKAKTGKAAVSAVLRQHPARENEASANWATVETTKNIPAQRSGVWVRAIMLVMIQSRQPSGSTGDVERTIAPVPCDPHRCKVGESQATSRDRSDEFQPGRGQATCWRPPSSGPWRALRTLPSGRCPQRDAMFVDQRAENFRQDPGQQAAKPRRARCRPSP